MIIGFCGPIGAGKSTAAKHLANSLGFMRLPFAGTLKSMSRAFGLTDEEVDGAKKNSPSELLAGKTPRQFMQLLGTDFGRNLIDSEIWVRAWRRQAVSYRDVVTDDVRFPNEAKVIRDLGGVLIRIERPGVATTESHVSEQQELDYDYMLLNSGTPHDLAFHVERLYTRIRSAA
jgi:hypothetical protein